MLQYRVSTSTVPPATAKILRCHLSRNCDRHIGRFRRTAHSLALELFDDRIEEFVSVLQIKDVQAHYQCGKLARLIAKPLRVDVTNGVVHRRSPRQDTAWPLACSNTGHAGQSFTASRGPQRG